MNIVVALKVVPDLVEELSVDEGGARLDTAWMRMIINEPDNHALEQALLLKDRHGAQVVVVAPDGPDVDDLLFTAAAKGADRLVKLTGDLADANNHALARALAGLVQGWEPEVVLTGVQAHNDVDGALGSLLAGYLGWPYVGYIAGATVGDRTADVRKEYPGGLVAEMTVALPAVLGIQAAEQPPRYVAVSKIRQTMKTATIETHAVTVLDVSGGPTVARMYVPESSAHATMIPGNEAAVADGLLAIFKQLGLV